MAMQAVILGFGGTGTQILTYLKDLTVGKYGKVPPGIRFLVSDTIGNWKPGDTVKILGGRGQETIAKGRETELSATSEYYQLKDHAPLLSDYVYKLLSEAGTPDDYPHLKNWLHTPWMRKHLQGDALNVVAGAAQQRQIGRFAVFQNREFLVQRLKSMILEASKLAAGKAVNVWIIGSAAGGTGAGCMLDAGFLVHLAAGQIKISLNGLIVMPNVYQGKEGVSLGRAYSFFRDVERMQGVGVEGRDYFDDNGQMVLHRVAYDARFKEVAALPKRLFDYLFYIGDTCTTDDARVAFFSSVANALDPYLDESSGPSLLEGSVNQTVAASSMGACRFSLPAVTLADLYAWEEVNDYLESVGAPKVSGNMVESLHSGSPPDRQREGRKRVTELLELFKRLLDLDGKKDEEYRSFADSLDARSIVEEWFQIAAAPLSPKDRQTVGLTYVNPFLSLSEVDLDKVKPEQRNVRTYTEGKKAGRKEPQERSRDRFAEDLTRVSAVYRHQGGGAESFLAGRNLVFQVVSEHLTGAIDKLVMDEIQRQAAKPWVDRRNQDQGTPLTRLLAEIQWMLQEPMRTIDQVAGSLVKAVESDRSSHEKQESEALSDLRAARPEGLLGKFGNWVEDPQVRARTELSDFMAWWQKRQLLGDTQELVRVARGRLEAWAASLSGVFDGMLRNTDSCWAAVHKEIRRLEDRLERMRNVPSARIGFSGVDRGLHGYRSILKRVCVGTEAGLHGTLLDGSAWKSVVEDGGIHVSFVLNKGLTGQPLGNEYDPQTVKQLHLDLYKVLREEIDVRLANQDVFDYLLHLESQSTGVPKELAGFLHESAKPLIKTVGVQDKVLLVYRDQSDVRKRDYLNRLKTELAAIRGGSMPNTEENYSDRFSLTLIRALSPQFDEIQDLADAKEEYLQRQRGSLSGKKTEDDEVCRSLAYHPFRGELEAMYIERRHAKKHNLLLKDIKHIPPRLARLLDEPELMRAFVHCVAAGAVEKVSSSRSWVWHDEKGDRDFILTDGSANPEADIIEAAVAFVLRRREAGTTREVNIRDAFVSAVKRAQKSGDTIDNRLGEHATTKLDSFLKENYRRTNLPSQAEADIEGLRKIFTFYCDPVTRTGLDYRLDP